MVWINKIVISPRMRGGSLIPKHLISPRNGLSWFTCGASVTQRVTEVLVHGNKMFSLDFENLLFIYRLEAPDWKKDIPVFISKYKIFIKTSWQNKTHYFKKRLKKLTAFFNISQETRNKLHSQKISLELS